MNIYGISQSATQLLLYNGRYFEQAKFEVQVHRSMLCLLLHNAE